MPSLAAFTIYAFGLTAFGAGVYNLTLTHPIAAAEMKANSLAAIAMGIYYPLAAYQENRAFFIATVPMRSLSATVFWNQGWKDAAIWEGTGAVLTGLALAWQAWGRSSSPGQEAKSHAS